MANNIQRVYLLLGPETGEKGKRIKEIRTALSQQYTNAMEIHRFYPFETMNGELFSTLENNSLFADHRLVILSQAEELNESQIADLVDYIHHPAPGATLLVISNETSLSRKLMASLPKDQIEVFWELFDERKSSWVRDFFRSAKMDIEANAVDLLLELVENNTEELRTVASQLIRFFSLDGTAKITESAVEQYIQHTRQESVFSLFEHMANSTLEKTLEVLNTLLLSGQQESVSLLAGLAWQFRRLISIEESVSGGLSWEEAAKQATVMGKPFPLTRKKDQATYRSASLRYPLEQARLIIARIGEYDILTRQMGAQMEQLLLEQCIMTIMVDHGKQQASLPFLSFSTDVNF